MLSFRKFGACLSLFLIAEESWANPVFTSTLGPQNSQCGYLPDPSVFDIAAGDLVTVNMIVPRGTRIVGWTCSGTMCTKNIQTPRGELVFEEPIHVDNGDPSHAGLGKLVFYDTAGNSDLDKCLDGCDGLPVTPFANCALDCLAVYPLDCCACPCETYCGGGWP